MSGQAGRYQRSVSGLITALVVLLLVLAGMSVLRSLLRSQPEATVRPVDYTAVADRARAEADLDILAPRTLPDGWVATSATWRSGGAQVWHLGVLTDAERYIGLEQADRTVTAMVETYVDPDAVEGQPVRVEGRAWRTFSDDGGDLALVRRDGETTTLLVGRVTEDVLVEYLGLLG